MRKVKHRDKNHGLKVAIFVCIVSIIIFILTIVSFKIVENKKSQGLGDVIIDSSAATFFPTFTPDKIIKQIEPTPTFYFDLPYVNPDTLGFSKEKLDEIGSFIQDEVDEGFPGAVLMVAKDGQIVYHESFGYAKKYDGTKLMENPLKMTDNTMFDLASLTKIYATTLSIMKLVDDGKLSLDDKILQYLDGFDEGHKKDITVEMLLSHCSGYTTHISFYKDNEEDGFYSVDRNHTLSLLSEIELNEKPGEVYKYSDVNYMIITALVEKNSGMTLEEYTKQYLYYPLNIHNEVTFRPLDKGVLPNTIAATERVGNTRDSSVYFEGVREYTLQGEVHDENSFYSFGQVSGHAGLFATPKALTVLNQVLLGKGTYNGVKIFSEETVELFLKVVNNEKYQRGFWNASSFDGLDSYVSDSTFYHNGWTGVASIIDLENNLSIILQTNKRHSPCVGNSFDGSTDFLTGRYITIIQKVYKALE